MKLLHESNGIPMHLIACHACHSLNTVLQESPCIGDTTVV